MIKNDGTYYSGDVKDFKMNGKGTELKILQGYSKKSFQLHHYQMKKGIWENDKNIVSINMKNTSDTEEINIHYEC